MDFGELRSVLARGPSKRGWARVCGLCDAAAVEDEARFEAELLPYVLDQLEGWPDALRIPYEGWLKVVAERGAHPCAPLIRRLEQGRFMVSEDVFYSPALAHVTELDLKPLGFPMLERLVGAPLMRSIEVLDCFGSVMGPERVGGALREMAALREVRSHGTQEQPLVIQALEAGERLAGLEALSMGHHGVQAEHMAWLGGCERLESLESYDHALFGQRGVEALCERLGHAPLKRLDVGGCGLDGRAVARLAEAPWRLESLHLWANTLDREAITRLAEAPAFERLASLHLRRCVGLGGDALAPLLGAPGALRALHIGQLAGVDWARLGIRPSGLGALELLDAEQCLMGVEAFERVLDGVQGGALKRLDVSTNHLDVRSAQALRGASLSGLERLEIAGNKIGDAGITALLEAPWIEGIKRLNVSGCGATPAIRAAFERAAPRLGALEELYIYFEGYEAMMGELLPGVNHIWAHRS